MAKKPKPESHAAQQLRLLRELDYMTGDHSMALPITWQQTIAESLRVLLKRTYQVDEK